MYVSFWQTHADVQQLCKRADLLRNLNISNVSECYFEFTVLRITLCRWNFGCWSAKVSDGVSAMCVAEQAVSFEPC